MITWMQRHKKWLIITIWISTIAFIGAGFVGWGQYSYGNKAGAVAKVGDIKISQSQLQKAYSRLYSQYSQALQGNFDEEKAKQYGLKQQALQSLLQQALILNLAASYDLITTNNELIKALEAQKVFQENGVFNKEVYKQVLAQNRLTPTEYETALKKELLIEKTLKLLPVEVSKNEKNILASIFKIADKIKYKEITLKSIKVNVTNEKLKKFWQNHKNDFMSDILYQIKFIKQAPITKEYDKNTVANYYQENKMHYKAKDGKILPLAKAKKQVIQELNQKATKEQALRMYIAFKKDRLKANVTQKETTISQSNNSFNSVALAKISQHSLSDPFMKPIKVGESYYIFKLTKITPAKAKSFAAAKAEVLPLYITEMKKENIIKLAINSLKKFSGKTTDFITVNETKKLTLLNKMEATNFLQKLFVSDKKKGFITLNDGNIILYNILEQKMLSKTNMKLNGEMRKLKSAIFNEGLIKKLQQMYKTEIYIKGL